MSLSERYLLRMVTEDPRFLAQPVSYSFVYERLRMYHMVLDIDDREMPHSFRAGCAVALALSGSVQNYGQIMKHVGWFS